MRLPYFVAVCLIFLVSAGLSLLAAGFAVTKVEDASEFAVRRALDLKGHNWAEVESDGLRVILTGTAPDEAIRFNALTAAGTEVDTSRVIDEMDVAATSALAAPRFSVEILRNDSGVSVIGLIPASEDRASLMDGLQALDSDHSVSDLVETADYPKPDGWDDALAYAVLALSDLPRAKIRPAPALSGSLRLPTASRKKSGWSKT